MYCTYRTAATLHTLEICFFFFRYMIVNTLHKGDNKDDDDDNNNNNNDVGTINSNDRITETLYSLGTWFVSGIYV